MVIVFFSLQPNHCRTLPPKTGFSVEQYECYTNFPDRLFSWDSRYRVYHIQKTYSNELSKYKSACLATLCVGSLHHAIETIRFQT